MSTVPNATSIPRRLALPDVDRQTLRVAGSIAALGALMVASVFLRSRALAAGFWIDEGLSVGIASFPLTEIPTVLSQDGSPPLYYLLLHLWMAVAGRAEEQTHMLSLFFAVATVPAALWAGWSLFEPRVGWFAAALAALNPFLTIHAQETRMYPLVVLLSILTTTAFLHAFVFERRRFLPFFGLGLALMLYTHNWALFYGFGTAVAIGVLLRRSSDRRALLIQAACVYGAVALVYAPWVPTLIFQVLHTGAPWSTPPPLQAPLARVSVLLGGQLPAFVLLLGAGAGIVALLEARETGDEGRRGAVVTLLVLGVTTLVVAWLVSQVAPAYTTRYLAVVMGPLLILAATGLGRSARLGIVAALLVAFFWTPGPPDLQSKSSTRDVVAEVKWMMHPGDLVVSTHPERTAVLDYYLPRGFDYATPLGRVDQPGVMDWRDSLPRLKAARPDKTLTPLLDDLPEGRRVLLVRPVIGARSDWSAPWTRLVRRRSAQWARALERDPRFVRRAVAPVSGRASQHGIRAMVYTKVSPPTRFSPASASTGR